MRNLWQIVCWENLGWREIHLNIYFVAKIKSPTHIFTRNVLFVLHIGEKFLFFLRKLKEKSTIAYFREHFAKMLNIFVHFYMCFSWNWTFARDFSGIFRAFGFSRTCLQKCINPVFDNFIHHHKWSAISLLIYIFTYIHISKKTSSMLFLYPSKIIWILLLEYSCSCNTAFAHKKALSCYTTQAQPVMWDVGWERPDNRKEKR